MNLIGCAHGTRSPAGRRAIGALIAAVRAARPELAVHTAFVDVQPPTLADVTRRVSASGPTVVVPLLLSSGYHVGVDIADAVAGATAVAAAALGPDPRLTGLLADRLAEAGLQPEDAVVLAAAGSSDPQSVADVQSVAAGLAAHHRGPITIGYGATRDPRVPAAVAAARSRHPERRIVIAAYLLAPGFFHDRLAQAGADTVSAPLLGPAPDPRLVQLVCARYDQARSRC